MIPTADQNHHLEVIQLQIGRGHNHLIDLRHVQPILDHLPKHSVILQLADLLYVLPKPTFLHVHQFVHHPINDNQT